jgi:hypothetical protein
LTRLGVALLAFSVELAGCLGISDPGIAVFAENSSGETYLLRFFDGTPAQIYEIPNGRSGFVTSLPGERRGSFDLLDRDCRFLDTKPLTSGDWLVRIVSDSETSAALRVEPTEAPRPHEQAFAQVNACE